MRAKKITPILLLVVAFLPQAVSARLDPEGVDTEVQILPAEVHELKELRLKTGAMRALPGGGSEPVYDLKRPAAGNAFVNVRLYIADAPEGFVVTREDLVVRGIEGPGHFPFDWFRELGLIEDRQPEIAVESQGILNATWEIPRPLLDSGVLIVKGREVGTLGKLRAGDRSHLELVVDSVREENEMRLKTDRFRTKPGGEKEPIYELHKPAAGNTYLNVRILVANEGEPVELERGDLRVESPAESGKRFLPVDWFLESGMEEIRGELLTIAERTILNFTVEVPREGMFPLRVLALDRDLGVFEAPVGGE